MRINVSHPSALSTNFSNATFRNDEGRGGSPRGPVASSMVGRGRCQLDRMWSSFIWRGETVPGAPVIRSVPLAVLGKAMQSRMLVRPA